MIRDFLDSEMNVSILFIGNGRTWQERGKNVASPSRPLQIGKINPNLTSVNDRKKSNRESTRVHAEIVSVLSRVPLFIVK